jgi:hypothetical protein
MSTNGKGDRDRVKDLKKYRDNYERIFKNKEKEAKKEEK